MQTLSKNEMQYAVWQMPHTEKDLAVLVDAAELPILDRGEEGVLNPDTPLNDDHLKLKLVYGVLMSNNLRGLQNYEGMNHLVDVHQDKWLVHLKPNDDEDKPLEAIYLGFEDMMVLHCRGLRQGDFAFAALMGLPDSLELHSDKLWGVTSFLRLHDLDMATNLINREIIISLVEEEVVEAELTKENWKSFVNEGLAKSLAKKVG